MDLQLIFTRQVTNYPRARRQENPVLGEFSDLNARKNIVVLVKSRNAIKFFSNVDITQDPVTINGVKLNFEYKDRRDSTHDYYESGLNPGELDTIMNYKKGKTTKVPVKTRVANVMKKTLRVKPKEPEPRRDSTHDYYESGLNPGELDKVMNYKPKEKSKSQIRREERDRIKRETAEKAKKEIDDLEKPCILPEGEIARVLRIRWTSNNQQGFADGSVRGITPEKADIHLERKRDSLTNQSFGYVSVESNEENNFLKSFTGKYMVVEGHTIGKMSRIYKGFNAVSNTEYRFIRCMVSLKLLLKISKNLPLMYNNY